MTKKIALVTGGNKGLGFETCRQLALQGWEVILTARDSQKGKEAIEKLTKQGIQVAFYPLDVSDPKSVGAVFEYVRKEWGRLDVLINNAGIALDLIEDESPSLVHTRERFLQTFDTNVVGTYLLCEAFFPLMQKQGYGRIVNVSSSAGQLAKMGDNYPAYRISKVAVNGVTCLFASKCQDLDILVNSVCPGWVKTDMGGPAAPLEVEEGVKSIIWAATLEKGGLNGSFIREKKPIAW